MSDVEATKKWAKELEASGALDELFSKIDSEEIELTGNGVLVPALVKASLERGLQAEMSAHLGYENGDRETKAGKGVRNYRNGSYGKSVTGPCPSLGRPFAPPVRRALV